MNLDTPFRQILLRVHKLLTPHEKECRFFYKEMLPNSHSHMSLLEIFEVLAQKKVISPYDVKSLKQFAVAVDRKDVAELLKVYEARVCVQMVIAGYLDFRSESRTNSVLETDFIARYLVRSHSNVDTEMALHVHKSVQKGFPLSVVATDLLPDLKEEFIWKAALEILQICSEIVCVRFLFTRNFKQLTSDIEEIMENVLTSVVPWMAEHGGLFGLECYSVIKGLHSHLESSVKTLR